MKVNGQLRTASSTGFVITTSDRYTAWEGLPVADTIALSFVVTNRNPIAVADTYTIRPNQTLDVAAPGLLGNDSDPDGDALSVSVLNVTGLKGLITPYADGHFNFTPTTNFAGTTSFTYTISDGVGGRSTATATINVVNSVPVAGNDHYAVHAGRTLDISAPGLLANDRDADSDALSVSVVNVSGLRGTLTPYADGHFSFTPTAGFVGTTSFSYTVSDGFGGNSTATVAIDVTNRNPIAKADTYTTRPNQTLNVAAPGLLGNDSDPDGDALSVSVLNVTGLKGLITPYADGHFNFTPTTNFAGTTSFTYTISDGVGGRSTATATINVVNSVPVAGNDHYVVHAGRTLDISAPGLLANDRDADSDALSVAVVNVSGLRGTLTPYADGHFSFTPTAGFVGTTSFSYTVSDGFGGNSTATVAIDVTNRNPIAKADTYTTRPNQTLNVAAPGLLGNDSDPDGDALNVSVLNVTGLKGTITPYADGHFNFTPTTNFAGTTSFTYTISDGVGGRSTATATINVVNSVPVAGNDHYAVHAGRTLDISAPGLLANDRDADSDALSVAVVNVSGLRGTLTPYADGHFSFTPTAGFVGTTSFSYTISDGFGGNSTATVAIDVTNRNPIAVADTYTIRSNQTLDVAAPGLLGNDSDPDGDALNVSVLNVTGLKGVITPYADGHFSFKPTTNFAGKTEFSYTISDGVGGRSTATATINVVNSAPVAGNDHYAVHAGRTLDISAPGLLANDRDADSDALSVSVVNVSGLRGTLTPYADGHFSFTPTAGFVGTTSFSYTISDGFGGNSTATVAIDVTNRNPIAKADTYTTRPNQTLNVAAPGLLGNDSDPDGDALNVSVLNVTGLKGTITPYADGHFNFTPTTNFAGTTSFTYTISDGVGGRSTATATINVVNSAPVAGNDHYAVHAGRTLDISAPGLLANDRDADSDALSVSVVNVSGLRGTLTPYADGHFSFTPTAGFVGTTSFSYTVSDGFGGNSTATVAIDVTNSAPVAGDDRYAVETGKTLEIAAPGLLANDHDGDGDALSVSLLNVKGLKGTLTPYADGHFSFTPTAGFTGTTSFSYKVSDGLGGSDSATVKIDVIAPTAALPPELPSGSAAQWAAVLANPAIVIVHKADYLDTEEIWSTVSATEASPQTLAGGDLYAGGLGVSGQSAATSSIKQEIDGREALRFNLAEKANTLTLYLSQFFSYDDGTAFVESGRLRLLDDGGRVVKELGFHANSGAGLQTVSLASDVAFSAIELNAGVAHGSEFMFGGYANPDGSFGSNVFADESGARHGSEFLVDKIVLGLPLGDAFSS
jgi:hypothetical protein